MKWLCFFIREEETRSKNMLMISRCSWLRWNVHGYRSSYHLNLWDCALWRSRTICFQSASRCLTPAFGLQVQRIHQDRDPSSCLSLIHKTRWPRDPTHLLGLGSSVRPRAPLELWGLLLPIKSALFKSAKGCCADSRYPLNCHTIIHNDSKQIMSYTSFEANFFVGSSI